MLRLAYGQGYLAECNTAFARLYGYDSAQEMVGARLEELLVRTDARNETYLRSFVRSGFALSDAESVERDREGNIKEFSNTLLGIVEDGKLTRAWGTQRDITAQKQAARSLQQSEARFRTLFDSSPFAIAILRDQQILFCNVAHARLFGESDPAALVGRSVWQHLAPEPSWTDASWTDASGPAQEPGEIRLYDGTATRTDGTRFEYHAQLAVLQLDDGPAGLAFTFDVTRQKADQLQRQNLLARERAAARRAYRLQEITSALAGALTADAVAEIIVDRSLDALDASAAALTLPASPDHTPDASQGAMLQLFRTNGYRPDQTTPYQQIPLDAELPISRCIRDKRPFWLTSRAAALAQFPQLQNPLDASNAQSLAAIPLLAKDRVLGALSLGKRWNRYTYAIARRSKTRSSLMGYRTRQILVSILNGG